MNINSAQYANILSLISAGNHASSQRDAALTELLNAIGVALGRVEHKLAEDVQHRVCGMVALHGRLDAMEGVLVEQVKGNTLIVAKLNEWVATWNKLVDNAQPRKRKGKKGLQKGK